MIGAWHRKGKRTGVYGAFLLASYNDESEEYETITKIGTGFSEEGLEAHFKALDGHVIDGPRQYYKWNERQADTEEKETPTERKEDSGAKRRADTKARGDAHAGAG